MFCSSLKKHGTNTHKFEKRKMLLLTKEERAKIKITSICSKLLHLLKKNLKKAH